MKITFDSNTWRKVASPNNFPKEVTIGDYKLIRQDITEGRITPFICETIFTLEAIKKIDRRQFFQDYEAVFETDVKTTEDGYISIGFKVGPNTNAHPGNNEFLKEHFRDAVQLGFNVIYLPRIAGITNREIEAYKYQMDSTTLNAYLNKVFEVGRRITELQAGDYEARELAKKYNPEAGFKGFADAPDSENGIIAKAVAEWADGDSVAAHIAVGGDYFCTNDEAKSAVSKSVFSANNQRILSLEYGFKTISPTALATILTSS